jgi:hypothetical protein
MTPPRAFISHNQADKLTAEAVTRQLRAKGVDAWFDKFEIAPGDSLTQKIFNEGVKDCGLFVVLLSPESVQSKWVQHELDVALIARIEQTTRIVPVVVRPCEIPQALKSLLRLDLSAGLDRVVTDLADVAHGRWPDRKPPVIPAALEHSADPEISDYAWAIATKLLPLLLEDGAPGWYRTDGFIEGLEITPQQLEDAMDELEKAQLIRFSGHFGSGDPYNFGNLQPTINLAVRMAQAGRLDFDLVEDLKTVVAAVAAGESLSAAELKERTGLSVTRLHLAINLVEGHHIANVVRGICGEYAFYQVDATPETRRWLRKNAK